MASITTERSTRVTFPANVVHGHSTLVAVVPVGERWGVVVEETPFHPVDYIWPDHPADLGTVTVGASEHAVLDCVVGATEVGSRTMFIGAEIPARRGDEGWYWHVVHVVEARPAAEPGTPVELSVDVTRRDGLSAGHTACELVTLAINSVFGGRWRKEVSTDVLGNPNFDGAAIVTSRIVPYASRDTYRLGKSLRRKGFVLEGLAEELPALEERINELLADWVREDGKVWVEAPEPALSARRSWNCVLAGQPVSVPCGGTHVTSTGRLGEVSVTLELSADGTELTMDTRVSPRG